MVHHTPSLSLQSTGACNQDHIPWGKWTRHEPNCPVCTQASTMPMQNCEGVNAANAWLCQAAMANGGDGKFEATERKVGCYCWGQNCFGDRDGIGYWNCINLTMEECELLYNEVEPGVCHFQCMLMQLPSNLCEKQASHHCQWTEEECNEVQAHQVLQVTEGGWSLALF